VKHFVANPAYNTPNIIIIAASPPKSTTGTGFSPVSRLFVAQYKLQACFLGKYGVFSGIIFHVSEPVGTIINRPQNQAEIWKIRPASRAVGTFSPEPIPHGDPVPRPLSSPSAPPSPRGKVLGAVEISKFLRMSGRALRVRGTIGFAWDFL
jgi:hypothetical protein